MLSTVDKASVPAEPAATGIEKLSPVTVALAISLFFATCLGIWLAFDNRVPSTDEAGHILNSLTFADLLRHAKPWKLHWLHEILTVNPFYPPFVYFFNGMLKLVGGVSIGVDKVSLVVFDIVLTLSTFGSARLLTRSTGAAAIAAVLVNLYPQNANMCHRYMLDFPLTAMVSLGFFTLLCWKQKPTLNRTLVTAVVLACACMTKQIAAAFLILPGLWCLYDAVRQDLRTRNFGRTCQLFAIAAIVFGSFAPWFLSNYGWIKKYAAENAANMTGLGAVLSPPQVFGDYVVGLAYSMSPLLTVALIASVVVLSAKQHRDLFPAYLLAFGGLIAISLLNWTFPLDRYASSVLVPTAIATGFGAVAFLGRFPIPAKEVIAMVAAVAFLQFFSYCYTPYPVQGAPVISALAPALGVTLREFRGAKIGRSCPDPTGFNWGQEWAISTVENADPHSPVWLNILPSQGIYNPHSFELLAKQMHASVRPTTSRTWTIMGDSVDFSPETAMWYHWYLLTTGDQGNKFKDAKSEQSYTKLVEFVRHSGKFSLRGEHRLPDGSNLLLYRQL